MKNINIGKTNVSSPQLAMGCMRIGDKSDKDIQNYISFCMEQGLNFFDHADIYGKGACEEKFGSAMKELHITRDQYILQSKCGIVPGIMYDCSKKHIINSVEDSLKRLQTDYLDFLLIHRPDALIEPEEVADAFYVLYNSGKVKHFGVSNFNSMQIQLLNKYILEIMKEEICANQLQFSIPHSNLISQGIEVNMCTEGSVNRDGSTLDFCRLNDITIQAWSPFQYGFFEGNFIGNTDKYSELNKVLNDLAKKYKETTGNLNITAETIATAWIMRHPARIQMITGSTNPAHIMPLVYASDINLTREEWYSLYLSAGHILP